MPFDRLEWTDRLCQPPSSMWRDGRQLHDDRCGQTTSRASSRCIVHGDLLADVAEGTTSQPARFFRRRVIRQTATGRKRSPHSVRH
ncbi:hypothetical protein JG687_00012407 [Phytophthora cactorum]|uniref:Uncharacterized protein n=2 Tax=Phytophthora TaxID=4783 RepID=A0A8J5J4K3_9STRA|nr:hypothetical protein GQ600_19034 [Phytophthora cactorum]KAG6953433.1 hypothetical protein JG687_00012407 [Phytophthora cactorum]KAG6957004.1 hypothetical protein JG688_00011171 [Phytophthora aleatoria]